MSGHDDKTIVPGEISADVSEFSNDEVTQLAYELWQARGCPDGSSEEDWFEALSQLQAAAKPKASVTAA